MNTSTKTIPVHPQPTTFNNALATYRVTQSPWYVDVYGATFAVRNETTGLSYNGIRYEDGKLAYDFPERIPSYVMVACESIMAK